MNTTWIIIAVIAILLLSKGGLLARLSKGLGSLSNGFIACAAFVLLWLVDPVLASALLLPAFAVIGVAFMVSGFFSK